MIVDLNRLLDNKQTVVLFKNQLGSYTAFSTPNGTHEILDVLEISDSNGNLTDDITPEQAIKRLADKVTRTGDYQ